MEGNYTRSARIFDILDPDINLIWDKLSELLDMKTEYTWEDWKDIWKTQLENMARDFTMSCRFALLRMLYSKAIGTTIGMAETEDSFEIVSKGVSYKFPKLTKKHVDAMSEDELSKYEKILIDIASSQQDASCNPEEYEYLIKKALRDEKGVNRIIYEGNVCVEGQQSTLSREEAFKLGHMLGFNLEEMSWFVLRVLDFEDTFRYFSSNDLIEAFGFCVGLSWQSVERLKKEYNKNVSDVDFQKVELKRGEDWTKSIMSTFPETVNIWMKKGINSAEREFMNWLIKLAPVLDSPSRTAVTIYRRLAVYIYQICNETEKAPAVLRLRHNIRELCGKESIRDKDIEELIYSEEKGINLEECQEISKMICSKFQRYYTEEKNPNDVWRILSVNDMGEACEKKRENVIEEILEEKVNPEKSDLLLLVWFCFNLSWENDDTMDFQRNLQKNIGLFYSTANEVLEHSLAAQFYPPHIQEQSMLLSIVASSYEDGELPAVHYVNIWESLKKRRNRNRNDDTTLKKEWEDGDKGIEGSVDNSIRRNYKNVLLGKYNLDGNYDGLLSILKDFMLDLDNRLAKDCSFAFQREGILYDNGNNQILLQYPNDKLISLFDTTRKDFENDECFKERFFYLCGLTYMLIDVLKRNGSDSYKCSFRKKITRDSKKVPILTLTKWELKEKKKK